MREKAIQIQGLSKSFKNFQVLNDISLVWTDSERGEGRVNLLTANSAVKKNIRLYPLFFILAECTLFR